MSTVQTPVVTAPPRGKPSRRRRSHRLSQRDRIILFVMAAVPAAIVVGIIWLPAVATVLLSFSSWDGFGALSAAKSVGLKNYSDVITTYPPFVPAIQHNLIWLAFLFLIPTPLGMFMAVLLDRELKGSRVFQSAFFMPVVLSLALTGFIWQLIYSRDQGLLNAVLGLKGDRAIDWYGDSSVNLWAVMVAASWKQMGYVMLLYLAGLKGVDASLREAAAIDGASERRTFFSVVFPVMRPINIIVVVVTVIESLRAFDLVWVVNKGRNGLELIGALVFSNIVGEGQRIGFGSALASIMMVISLIFVAFYVRTVLREDKA
ncbi:MAG: sugar ABC transporter permease [Actinomycetota bacterium]